MKRLALTLLIAAAGGGAWAAEPERPRGERGADRFAQEFQPREFQPRDQRRGVQCPRARDQFTRGFEGEIDREFGRPTEAPLLRGERRA